MPFEFPVSFSSRLKQFICKHRITTKSVIHKGTNRMEGWNYVFWRCGKCNWSVATWEKDEDFFKDKI